MNYIDSLLVKIPELNFNPFFKYLWENITFETMLKIFIVYFFIVWISIVIWVIKDIGNRTDSIILQIFSILIVLFLTPLGIFLYLIIRPGRTVFERYYEEIEDNLDLLSKDIKNKFHNKGKKIKCYNCKSKIENDFIYCPECKIKLKEKCFSCKKEIRGGWNICPYCGKEKTKLKEIKLDNIKDDKNLIVENNTKIKENINGKENIKSDNSPKKDSFSKKII